MNDVCEYEHDGFDTDGTEWFLCVTHNELAPSKDAPCAGSYELPHKGLGPGGDNSPEDVPDADLPGMWERADFLGGQGEPRPPGGET